MGSPAEKRVRSEERSYLCTNSSDLCMSMRKAVGAEKSCVNLLTDCKIGLRAQGFGLWASGLGLRVSGFRVSGFGLRASSGFGFRVSGF
jgi:hypothetical protein